MSISGGLEKALFRGQETECQVIQLFTQNPNRWLSRDMSAEEIEAFRLARFQTSVVPIASHDSYLINLASPSRDGRRRSLEALTDEVMRTHRLGIPYVVMHPGAHSGDGEKKGIRHIAGALTRMLERTRSTGVVILLETTAGQGTSLGYRFEHLAEIIRLTEPNCRLAVCLDTCHIFAAGYAFGDRDSFEGLIREFDAVIGLDRLKLIHANDSRKACGSRIDRHEHIGRGLIGEEGFSLFLKSPVFEDLPFILETPKGTDAHGRDLDRVNLSVLRRLMEERTVDDCI